METSVELYTKALGLMDEGSLGREHVDYNLANVRKRLMDDAGGQD